VGHDGSRILGCGVGTKREMVVGGKDERRKGVTLSYLAMIGKIMLFISSDRWKFALSSPVTRTAHSK
jgi:hypothetical protein